MSFKGDLIVKKVSRYEYELWKSFSYTGEDGKKWVCPKGFQSDGASIPRVAWHIIGSPMTGLYTIAAFLHDWFYENQPVTREYADRLFLEGMKDCGVNRFKRWLMYRCVRAVAWIPWRNFQKNLPKSPTEYAK